MFTINEMPNLCETSRGMVEMVLTKNFFGKMEKETTSNFFASHVAAASRVGVLNMENKKNITANGTRLSRE